MFDLVVVFSDRGLYLLNAEPNGKGLLLHRVLLLLQGLYLLQHPLILLLHLRKCSLEDKIRKTVVLDLLKGLLEIRCGDCSQLQQKSNEPFLNFTNYFFFNIVSYLLKKKKKGTQK